jgi:PDZ domain-containing protein
MRSVRTARRIAILLVVAGALVLSTTVWLPLYSLGPGPARDVEPLIQVSGHPVYPSRGRFVMTSVEFNQLTPAGALFAWLDPNRAVVSRNELFAPGETSQQERTRAISQMDQSKLDAAYVVLSRLTGYPRDHDPGALVEGVVPGCPADGRLFPGDLIRAIDGTPVRGSAAASRIIESVPSGSRLSFAITVDGRNQEVSLVRRPCGGERKPLVGISLIPEFPFEVRIESGDVGGPSAGLMWALGLYDLLTPGDLTGGRMIAGTGAIGLDGTVYPIGGIGQKVVAAEQAGASVFLVPKANYEDARAAAKGGLTLVPVSSFQDALDYLKGVRSGAGGGA